MNLRFSGFLDELLWWRLFGGADARIAGRLPSPPRLHSWVPKGGQSHRRAVRRRAVSQGRPDWTGKNNHMISHSDGVG